MRLGVSTEKAGVWILAHAAGCFSKKMAADMLERIC